MEKEFIICDNSINRYGWRLLVEGIDLSGFLKNPVCCVNHDTREIPVGRWKNLRIENEQLIGVLEFDADDEKAVMLHKKYEKGFLNAVSLNILPLEESEDKSVLLVGQRYPTITKSDLLEISLVTVPGQRNAVKLTAPGGGIEYTFNKQINSNEMAKEEKTVEQLKLELEEQKKLNAQNLVLLHKARGVVQDGEVGSLKELALSSYKIVSEMLEARVPTPDGDGAETLEAKAKALVSLHFTRGVITEPEVKIFEESAKLDYDGVKRVLEAKQGIEGVKTFVQGMNTGKQAEPSGERAGWGYYDYFKKDPQALSFMEKNEPEKYKTLVADFHAKNEVLGVNG